MFYDHYDTPRVISDAITGVRPGTHVDLGLTKSVVIISLQCKAKIDKFSQSIYYLSMIVGYIHVCAVILENHFLKFLLPDDNLIFCADW